MPSDREIWQHLNLGAIMVAPLIVTCKKKTLNPYWDRNGASHTRSGQVQTEPSCWNQSHAFRNASSTFPIRYSNSRIALLRRYQCYNCSIFSETDLSSGSFFENFPTRLPQNPTRWPSGLGIRCTGRRRPITFVMRLPSSPTVSLKVRRLFSSLGSYKSAQSTLFNREYTSTPSTIRSL